MSYGLVSYGAMGQGGRGMVCMVRLGGSVWVWYGEVRYGQSWRSINLILTREEYYNGKF